MRLRLYQNTDLHSTYRDLCQCQRGCSTASRISLVPSIYLSRTGSIWEIRLRLLSQILTYTHNRYVCHVWIYEWHDVPTHKCHETYVSLVSVWHGFRHYVSPHMTHVILTTKNILTVLSRMFDCVSHLYSTCVDSFSEQCTMSCVLHTHA